MAEINTHDMTMKNGKHAGELITRVPVNYLKWMVCVGHSDAAVAEAEMKRRGTVTPNLDVSGHAIDRASLYCWNIYLESRQDNEGLHAWLVRTSEAAFKKGREHNGKRIYMNMKFCFELDGKWPVLKTVMPA